MSATPKFKILVIHPEVPKPALDLLEESHCQLIQLKTFPPQRAEILANIKGVDGVLWGGHEPIDGAILDAAGPQLKAVSVISAGIDFVDVEAFKQRKIPLGHTPNVLNDAVADMAMGLMLNAARRIHEGYQKIVNDKWEVNHLDWMLGQEIRGATVGIYGFGNIGRKIGDRLKGFNIDGILYSNRHALPAEIEKEYNAKCVPFDEMLSKSDIIFVAAPLTPETKGKFDAAAFAKMKKTAVFVNVGRGAIVKQDDLYNALKNNQIFSAGLDVMTPEPLPPNDPLTTLPNCVLTPHISSGTSRTRCDMAIVAAHNILRGIAGEPMFSPVY